MADLICSNDRELSIWWHEFIVFRFRRKWTRRLTADCWRHQLDCIVDLLGEVLRPMLVLLCRGSCLFQVFQHQGSNKISNTNRILRWWTFDSKELLSLLVAHMPIS